MQILCLGLGEGFLPLLHRMWGILSSSSMLLGLQRQEEVVRGWREICSTGRMSAWPETEPCSAGQPLKFLEFTA